jgi:hypothetical protein
MNNFYDILSMYNVHIYYLLKLEDSLKNMATFIIYETVVFHYLSASESGLIRGVGIGGSGLIRGGLLYRACQVSLNLHAPPLYTSLTKDICQTIGDIVQGWIPARAPPKIGKNMIFWH